MEIRGYEKPIKLEVKKPCSIHSFIIYSFTKLNLSVPSVCLCFQSSRKTTFNTMSSYSLFSKLLLIQALKIKIMKLGNQNRNKSSSIFLSLNGHVYKIQVTTTTDYICSAQVS